MTRTFFIECSGPIWQAVVARCMTQAQWQPVLWTAADADATAITALCPAALFLAGPDAALGLPAPTWPLPTLDASLLVSLAPAESIVLHMMDRMDPACGVGFGHDARRRHYHHLLRYWLGALDALTPDLIVFSIAPHIVFDYIVLTLARHRGIPTIMFERIGLPGWVFPLNHFDQGSPELRSELHKNLQLPPQQLPQVFHDWLTASTNGQAAVPANFQKKLERYKMDGSAEGPSLLRTLIFEFKRAAALFRKNGLKPAANSYLRSQHYPHGRCGPVEAFVSRLKGFFAKRRLMRFHDARTQKPEDKANYVLLALHYQPERATVPMGGEFGDQTLIVDLLASNLPVGWKLYVKEHPWQLQSFGRGEVQRSEAFYAFISTHPNAVLLPRHTSTSQLVRGARAVATVTGSVGWDALCSGIPVLLFGPAWYRDCPGIFYVTSRSDVIAAVNEISSQVVPHLSEVTAFCGALARVCVPGVLEPEIESVENFHLDNIADSLSAALIEYRARQSATDDAHND